MERSRGRQGRRVQGKERKRVRWVRKQETGRGGCGERERDGEKWNHPLTSLSSLLPDSSIL